jgi:putative spermidine/putrescine transport system substrate-binding protein
MTDDGLDVHRICGELRTLLQTTATRRELLQGLSALGLASLAGPAFAEEQPVTAFIFGGAWKRAFVEAIATPFTTKTGIPVRTQEPYTLAKLRAMHEAKAMQIDLVSMGGPDAIMSNRLKIAAPIDWTLIDRSKLSAKQLAQPNCIGGYSLTEVICYNNKTWSAANAPQSWADFWNVQKFPGRRALRRDAIWTMEAALLADGVKEDAFDPIDVERAFKSLDRIKPHVKTWWSDNSQAQQMMQQEEVDLIAMMDGRANESILSQHAPFTIVWNQGLSIGGQGWIVPVGAPNPRGGMKLMELAVQPETLAVFARLLFYAPMNEKAYDFIDPTVAKSLASYPDNEKRLHKMNDEWWVDNLTRVGRQFERWLQS